MTRTPIRTLLERILERIARLETHINRKQTALMASVEEVQASVDQVKSDVETLISRSGEGINPEALDPIKATLDQLDEQVKAA